MYLWNLFYSWGRQCFWVAGSWECDFVDNWFVVLQYRAIQYFIKRSWGCTFVGRVNLQIHKHRSPRTMMTPQYLGFSSPISMARTVNVKQKRDFQLKCNSVQDFYILCWIYVDRSRILYIHLTSVRRIKAGNSKR